MVQLEHDLTISLLVVKLMNCSDNIQYILWRLFKMLQKNLNQTLQHWISVGGGGWLLFWLKHPPFESSNKCPGALYSRRLGGGPNNTVLVAKCCWTEEKHWTKRIDFCSTRVRKRLLLPTLFQYVTLLRFKTMLKTSPEDSCHHKASAKLMLILHVSIHQSLSYEV